jgi:hypothetical protein
MLEADSILEVSPMVRRATDLGRRVMICRFDGALHDVLLSGGRCAGKSTANSTGGSAATR